MERGAWTRGEGGGEVKEALLFTCRSSSSHPPSPFPFPRLLPPPLLPAPLVIRVAQPAVKAGILFGLEAIIKSGHKKNDHDDRAGH